MASPVVATQTEGAVTSAGTSHTVAFPASSAAGDLILVFFTTAALQATMSAGDGFSKLQLDPASGNHWFALFYKEIDGSEGGDVVITTGGSTKSAWTIHRVTGAEDPATQAPEKATVATGTSTTPDCPNIVPTGGPKDFLYFASFRQSGEYTTGDDAWANSGPSGYTFATATLGHSKTTGSAGAASANCEIGTAYKETTASSSDNPGTFSVDSSIAWQAQTIAIHPAGAVADADAEVAWTEFEVPTANARADVSWAEFEVPTADARADVAWAEFEVPTADARADVAWTEFQVPDFAVDADAEVAWAEVEVPTADSSAQVAWAEFEVPAADARADIAWAEFEVPGADADAEVAWTEFEVENAPARADVSWTEFEVPTAESRADVSWAEFEVPTADSRADVAWTEVEVPDSIADADAEIAWIEFEVPALDARADVSWAELQVPDFGAEGPLTDHEWIDLWIAVITVVCKDHNHRHYPHRVYLSPTEPEFLDPVRDDE